MYVPIILFVMLVALVSWYLLDDQHHWVNGTGPYQCRCPHCKP